MVEADLKRSSLRVIEKAKQLCSQLKTYEEAVEVAN